MAYEVDQYTVSLLHFDDGIKDETGKVWTAQNGATTSSDKSKFGGSSLSLNGTNQYLTVPNSSDFDFGSGDFTIDWWEYRTANNTYGAVFARNLNAFTNYIVGDNIGGTLMCYLSNSGSSWDIANAKSMGTVILNEWVHYALVRKESVFYTFQNGVLKSSWESNIPFIAASGTPSIGNNAGQYFFKGYIDEFRVSKGIARWTADFPLPGTVVAPNAPINLTATPGNAQVILNWDAVTGATGYNIKRSTTPGGPYTTTVGTNVSGTSYVDTTVVNGTTYYYVVTAVNADGESANSNEASATPEGNSLLRITMSDSSEREYEVNTTELNSFLTWFNRIIGTGNSYYSFEKTVGNKNRTEYLSYDKIISIKKVIGGNLLILRIIMSDSSEREYKVASSDDFITWANRTVAVCQSGTAYYELTDPVDGNIEFLAFDKIISFEVIPL